MSNDMHHVIDRLTVRTATLAAENRHLRRIAQDTRHGGILRRTLTDAQTLLVWRFAGLSISRRACADMGMSERRWGAARGLLVLARLHDGYDVVERDFEACKTAVETATRQLERHGLGRLRARMARRGR